MPRPVKKRIIWNYPKITCFKPAWVPKRFLDKVEIWIDEYEAMRWFDYVWLNTQKWAEKMWISASTFNRVLASGRKKIIDAFVNGKWIRLYNLEEDKDCL